MAKPLDQDPHSTAPLRERVLEVAIGKEVRAHRTRKKLTVSDLAARAGLSQGMLSKIETGAISASLTSLRALADALSVPITSFFDSFEERREAVHTRAGTGIEAERAGTRAGHHYTLLGHLGANVSGVTVEPYLITLSDASDSFAAFQHQGIETIYMLEGEIRYQHGPDLYHLRPGDTLFFDADAPHGPEELIVLPARYLSIISYPQRR